MTRLVCQQLGPRIGDLPANLERTVRAIGDAVALGADVVVLPELVTSGYVFESADEARAVAITPAHELFGAWAEAARGATVIGGFCEAGEDGLLYNSAAVVAAGGVRAVYRKTHLWDREKLVFEPGGAPPPVVETPHGRIGVLLCYDMEFPEMTRGLALAGADLIAVPTNWPLVERPEGERAPEVVIAMAAARVNHVFVACCDRTLTERDQAWTSGTHIIDDSGWVLAKVDGEGPALADVDLAHAREKAFTELADPLRDRRPELYGAVTQQRT